MRVYVIRDFSSEPVRVLLEGMRELYPNHRGQPIVWDIPGLQAQGGQIARDIVYRPIRDADHAIALLDTPNANVAWEAGLALGFGKSVRLVYVGSALPPWTQLGALKNLVLHHVYDVNDTEKLLAPLRFELHYEPAKTADKTMLLCPGGPEGSTLHTLAHRDFAELGRLPEEGWGLYEVPAMLAAYGRLVWVIASYPDISDAPSSLRDGAQNAANGVIAGLAEAWGLEVVVLRSKAARVVADVQPRERTFRGIGEFRARLKDVLAQPPRVRS